MTEKRDWNDILNSSQEDLFDISIILQKYAKGFHTVGNKKIGALLDDLSVNLERISNDIGFASGTIVSERFKTSQENSANVLNATLAGIKVATRDKKKEDE